ncbi:hypothetical protein RB195_000760 [Necator americanus]|uniref:Uncharacterized protein n=1 Tax=Necator americanus TaxID=51031 RepID=A0ABR1DE78_NECAM
MEYTYAPSTSDTTSLGSIGSYYCSNNTDLCVEDVFGRQWHPAQAENLITIIPTARCMEAGRHCGVFLLLVASRPSLTSDLVSSTSEGIRYRDMIEEGQFISFSNHVYVPIKGLSCNSCRDLFCRPR